MRLRLRVGWRSIPVIRRVVRRGMCVRLVYASRGPDARGGAGGWLLPYEAAICRHVAVPKRYKPRRKVTTVLKISPNRLLLLGIVSKKKYLNGVVSAPSF